MVLSETQRLRNINLIEVLAEEAAAEGRHVEEPEDLADRSEEEIRVFFGAAPAIQQAAGIDIAAEFKKWFPGLALSGTACSSPKLRVLCFPNAGNAEDMYTNEGTGSRRAPSPLLEWCRANAAECLAVQLPGRNLRRSEPALSSCQDLAGALVPILASRLSTVPYVVIAHSVGCWNAFEFLQLARERGIPLPLQAFLSAMPTPDLDITERPWRQQHTLSEAEFKEECLGWDVNMVVFTPAMWPTYQPLMRADFTLFDQYKFQHQGKPAFDFPLTMFWGSEDRRVKQNMVAAWQKFTAAAFDIIPIEGHHLWPLQAGPKAAWLQHIVAKLPHV